jgi:hypothetical protein
VDNAGQPATRGAANDQLDSTRVGVLDEARFRTAQVDERRSVDDSVAASERLVHGARVRHVADRDVSGNEAVRLEHAAHLGRVAH